MLIPDAVQVERPDDSGCFQRAFACIIFFG
jgi:hypothetical protein